MNFNNLLSAFTFAFGLSYGISYSTNNNYLLCENYVEDTFIDSKTETLDKTELIILTSKQVKIIPNASSLVEGLSETINKKDPIHYDVIKKYYELALNEQKIYGFPASVKLAQMILEGGYSINNPNGSLLVQNGNNPFGIKYFGDYVPSRINNWEYFAYTGEWVSAFDDCGSDKCRFIKFRGMSHSFRYHSKFMVGSIEQPSHYLKWVNKGDWEDWLFAIEKGGYATDQNYVKKLRYIIENYKLYLIDVYVNFVV